MLLKEVVTGDEDSSSFKLALLTLSYTLEQVVVPVRGVIDDEKGKRESRTVQTGAKLPKSAHRQWLRPGGGREKSPLKLVPVSRWMAHYTIVLLVCSST